MCSANKAITLAQDRAAQANLCCQQLEKSITRLVAERQDLQGQLEGVEWERKREKRRREEYGSKMERHRQRVSSAEEDSEAHRELAELQHKKQWLEDSSKLILYYVHVVLFKYKDHFRGIVHAWRRATDSEWREAETTAGMHHRSRDILHSSG